VRDGGGGTAGIEIPEMSAEAESAAPRTDLRRFTSDIARVAGGNIGAQAILFLASPILTRLYRPEDLGIAQVVIASAGCVNLVSTLRYELAIPLPESDRDGRLLLALCIALNALSGALLAGVVALFGVPLARALGIDGATTALWLLPAIVFAGGITQVVEAWSTRTRKFGELARYRMTTTWSGVITQLGLGGAGFQNPLGILLGKLVGPLVATVRFGLRAMRPRSVPAKEGDADLDAKIDLHESKADAGASLRRTRELAWRYRAFPIWNTWSSVVNFVAAELPTWILAFHGDPQSVGCFAIATLVLRAPMQILGNAVSRVFLGEGAHAAREGRLGELTERALSVCAALGIVPVIGALSVGRELSAIFGKEWHEAGIYIEILAPAVFVRFLASPISQIFALAERQRAQVVFQLAQCAATFAIVATASAFLGPRGTIGAFAFAVGAKYLFLSWWLLGIAGADRSRAAWRVGRIVARALPLAAVLLALKWSLGANAIVVVASAVLLAPVTLWWILARELPELKAWFRSSGRR